MRKTHRQVLKSDRLSKVLTSYPRIASRNAKFLKDPLDRSTLKPESDVGISTFKCDSKRYKTCKILYYGNKIKSFMTKKKK